MLKSAPDNFTMLLHGNAYRDRKVMLSNQLITAGELTDPTVVKSTEIKERFLKEVSSAVKKKSRWQATDSLVSVLPRQRGGASVTGLRAERKDLSIQELKGVVGIYDRVTL